jgi:N-methylhydantoinase B
MCYVPHDVDEIPVKIMHAIGTLQPGSSGIAGGYPSCTNQFAIKRGTDVWATFARGELPGDLDELDGTMEVYPESIVRTSQGRDDVYRCVAMGGAGYGDPLDREPERVHADVVSGVVTVDHAGARYGVVLVADCSAVDEEATASCRETIRAERLAQAVPASELVTGS